MPYEIQSHAHFEDIIEWLQTNVGDLQWSRPIVEWKGRGWTVNMTFADKPQYIIRIEDPKLATITALRWSA